MRPSKQLIDRMGFEGWADNAIVDMMENMPAGCTSMSYDFEDVSVRINMVGTDLVGWVRAYVPGYGWKHHERTIRRGDK